MAADDLPALVALLERAVVDPTGALNGGGGGGEPTPEAALAALEERPGFCSLLLAVASDPSCAASHPARWLAAVQLKNAIGRQWRPRGGGGAHAGVSAEEKAALRPRLVAALATSPLLDARLAAQLAVALGKVARWDWPREWPDLVPSLLAAAEAAKREEPAQRQGQQHENGASAAAPTPAPASLRLYLGLHHVIKELSSKRLSSDRRAFGELTRSGLLDAVWAAWIADLRQAMAAAAAAAAGAGQEHQPQPQQQHQHQEQQRAAFLLERWLLEDKVVRRLLVWGVDGDAATRAPAPPAVACLPGLLEAARALLSAADQQQQQQQQQPHQQQHRRLPLRRCALKSLKTLAAVQGAHPWAALLGAGTMVPALELAFGRVMAAAERAEGAAAASEQQQQQQQPKDDDSDDDDDDEDDEDGKSAGKDPEEDPLLVRSALLLLDALQCEAFRGGGGGRSRAAAGADEAAAAHEAAQRALAAFWEGPVASSSGPQGQQQQQQPQQQEEPRFVALARALVARVGLPLTARDLRLWRRDPESFFHSPRSGGGGLGLEGGGFGGFGGGFGGVGGASADSLRSAAEALLVVLARQRRDSLAPVLAAEIGAAVAAAAAAPAARGGPAPLAPLLRKDAAYAAAALLCEELHDHVDYAPWLRGSLLPELAAASAAAAPAAPPPSSPPAMAARVARRAAARVLGSWAPRLPQEDKAAAYAALAACLDAGDGGGGGAAAAPASSSPPSSSSSSDSCVALTAAAALRALAHDLSFDADAFAPAAPRAMDGLARLLSASSDLDTQTQAFGLFGLLIDRLGPAVRPLVPGLLQLLPRVWEAAGGSRLGPGGGPLSSSSSAVSQAADSGRSLLRIQVLAALAGLVNALAEESALLLPGAVAPAVAQALPTGGYGDELAEDALALWIVAARNCPSLPWSVDGGAQAEATGAAGVAGAAASPEVAAAAAAFAAAAGADEQQRQQQYAQTPQLALLASPTLLPKLAALMRHSTEHLPATTVLLQSLLLLGGSPYASAVAAELGSTLAALAPEVSERGALLLLPPMDLLLRLSPDAGAAALAPAIATLLVEAALPKVLEDKAVGAATGAGATAAEQEAAAERRERAAIEARRNPRVASGVFALLARLLLLRPAAFEAVVGTPEVARAAAAVTAAGGGTGNGGGVNNNGAITTTSDVLLGLASCWVSAADAAAGRLARKLHAAGLTALLAAAPGPLAPLLDAICGQAAGAWAELEQGRRFGGGDGGGEPAAAAPPFYDDDDMLYLESPFLGGRSARRGCGGDDDGDEGDDGGDAAALLQQGVLGTDAVLYSGDAAGDCGRRLAAAAAPRWEPLRTVRVAGALRAALGACGGAAAAERLSPAVRAAVERAVAGLG